MNRTTFLIPIYSPTEWEIALKSGGSLLAPHWHSQSCLQIPSLTQRWKLECYHWWGHLTCPFFTGLFLMRHVGYFCMLLRLRSEPALNVVEGTASVAACFTAKPMVIARLIIIPAISFLLFEITRKICWFGWYLLPAAYVWHCKENLYWLWAV